MLEGRLGGNMRHRSAQGVHSTPTLRDGHQDNPGGGVQGQVWRWG
jgi:hypothetical protein